MDDPCVSFGGAQVTADYLFGGAGADLFVVQNSGANVTQRFDRAEAD
jgi:Ca2+-binding RTX toxin-like protein